MDYIDLIFFFELREVCSSHFSGVGWRRNKREGGGKGRRREGEEEGKGGREREREREREIYRPQKSCVFTITDIVRHR